MADDFQAKWCVGYFEFPLIRAKPHEDSFPLTSRSRLTRRNHNEIIIRGSASFCIRFQEKTREPHSHEEDEEENRSEKGGFDRPNL